MLFFSSFMHSELHTVFCTVNAVEKKKTSTHIFLSPQGCVKLESLVLIGTTSATTGFKSNINIHFSKGSYCNTQF